MDKFEKHECLIYGGSGPHLKHDGIPLQGTALLLNDPEFTGLINAPELDHVEPLVHTMEWERVVLAFAGDRMLHNESSV